ncbi:MAG TPA: J domain-containing protein [bacterium]|nr:J domain-containing protein [bacterium]HPN44528.1 J domain-containing protein [bacterium]
MLDKDYYKILGVSESATESEIKKAYRDLAKKNHPDTHPNNKANEARFKEISEAYSVLGNTEKKQKYDQLRKLGAGGSTFGERGGFSGTGGFDFQDFSSTFGGGRGRRTTSFEGFGDLFGQLFRGAGESATDSRPSRTPGSDIKTSITIPFELAITGGKHVVTLKYRETCPKCQGSGQFCVDCNGSGYGLKSKTVSVNIPAAVEDGKTIRLKGLGEPSSRGGANGNLLLTIQIEKHPMFERRGLDLYSKTAINMVQAALGSRVRVKTFQGNTVELKIPAGTGSGKLLKLKGMGISNNGQTGDHIVEIQIEVPQNLGKKSRELLQDLAKEEGIEL